MQFTTSWFEISVKDFSMMHRYIFRHALASFLIIGLALITLSFILRNGFFLLFGLLTMTGYLVMVGYISLIAHSSPGKYVRQGRRFRISEERTHVEIKDGTIVDFPTANITRAKRIKSWLVLYVASGIFYPVSEFAFDNPADFDAVVDILAKAGKIPPQKPTRAV